MRGPVFFNLIQQSDVFVFLDDAQFTSGDKNSWQNRNRILLNGKTHTLTVPSIRSHLGQSLKEICVDDKQNWRKKHLQTLSHAYSKHPFAAEMFEVVEPILCGTDPLLSDISIKLIRGFCTVLKLEKEFHRASELNIPGERTERLVNICKFFNCDEYFSPGRAQQYLEEDGDFKNSQVSVRLQNFQPAPYPQKVTDEFVSRLSIVDVLASLGSQETQRYIN